MVAEVAKVAEVVEVATIMAILPRHGLRRRSAPGAAHITQTNPLRYLQPSPKYGNSREVARVVAEVAKVAEVAEVTTKFYFYLIVQEARSNKRTKIFKILTKIHLSLFPPPPHLLPADSPPCRPPPRTRLRSPPRRPCGAHIRYGASPYTPTPTFYLPW